MLNLPKRKSMKVSLCSTPILWSVCGARWKWQSTICSLEFSPTNPLFSRTTLLEEIRVPLADFQVLETDERMRLLIRELGRTPGAGRRQGVDQFEALLSHFALSGDVERQVKQDILEINHVRNVIVHRGSLADRRLTQCCPWMDLRIGDKVLVTPVGFRRYSQALESYVLEITYRVGYRYGIDTKALVEEREKQNASRESSTGSVP